MSQPFHCCCWLLLLLLMVSHVVCTYAACLRSKWHPNRHTPDNKAPNDCFKGVACCVWCLLLLTCITLLAGAFCDCFAASGTLIGTRATRRRQKTASRRLLLRMRRCLTLRSGACTTRWVLMQQKSSGSAGVRCKSIAAYETLSDPEKRRMYDQVGLYL